MASGSYAKKPVAPRFDEPATVIPPRATRKLEASVEEEPETGVARLHAAITKALHLLPAVQTVEKEVAESARNRRTVNVNRVVDAIKPDPLKRHRAWLSRLIIAIACTVIICGILLWAAMAQRSGPPQLVDFPGKVYDAQVGGNTLAHSWQSNQPIPAKTAIPTNNGPYTLLGKPTITADFINQVLAAHHSPAAGKGQALYDLGVQYGIDPVYALAFFMHESSFGTAGEARITMSLGNLRCIPDHPCIDQDRGGYAKMASWEDGFKTWYELIRNLYIAQWGRTTVDQIIPRYAPSADNNNEAAYIRSVKHAIDTWHAGLINP